MLLNFRRIFRHAGSAALLLAACALSAQAQTAVRGPVSGAAIPAVTDKAAPDAATTDKTGAAANKTAEAQPKFPNKDTAKNRKDYDMGTGTGGIELGNDEATGDTVMRHNPPKKVQEPYPYEKMPIEVRPIIVR